MLSKRVVAICGDKLFAKRLAAGLSAAGGTVETVAQPEDLAKGEITADLVLVHLTDDKDNVLSRVEARLKKDSALIAVIPTSSLELTVKCMMSGRVHAVLVADQITPAALSAIATRLLFGDIFGVEKVVPWGVKIYSMLCGDYQEKSVAIAAVSDFAAHMGIRRKYRESIEQCLDEMLMNALYDAPVDSAGKQMFADVPTKTRISLRMEQKAVVQYACDGDFFALSVRDSFGALKGETVVKYLDKCLHSEQQIDRKAGGAGLGLYIISNAATQFFTNIYPGVATEAMCTFDLNAAKVQLKEFGVFNEKIDSAARLVAGPSKLVTTGVSAMPELHGGAPAAAQASRGVVLALGTAIVLLLALIGIVAYPRFAGPGRGSIAVTTDPPGANVEIDGRSVGSTTNGPLTLSDLDAEHAYKVTARLDGYDPVDEVVTPLKDGVSPITIPLHAKKATLLVDSEPAGASIVVGGKELGTTPATITDLPPGSEQTITLKKIGYADLTRATKVPAPGREGSVMLSMNMAPDFGSVTIESDPPGAQVVQNGELLAGLVTPVNEHIVQAGKSYQFTLRMPGFMPEQRAVKVDAGQRRVPLKVQFKAGAGLTVDVNVPEAHVTVDGVAACTDRPTPMNDCPVATGHYNVKILAARPYVAESFGVDVKGGDVVKKVDLGYVETAAADLVLLIPGSPRGTRKAALSEGNHKVRVQNNKTNEVSEETVRVQAGKTMIVEGKKPQ